MRLADSAIQPAKRDGKLEQGDKRKEQSPRRQQNQKQELDVDSAMAAAFAKLRG